MARLTVTADVLPAAGYNPSSTANGAGTDGLTAIGTAVTAALADPTIDGDPTAKGLVEDIEAAQLACLTDVYVSFDTSSVTSRDQLRGAFDAVLRYAVGNGLVTP